MREAHMMYIIMPSVDILCCSAGIVSDTDRIRHGSDRTYLVRIIQLYIIVSGWGPATLDTVS